MLIEDTEDCPFAKIYCWVREVLSQSLAGESIAMRGPDNRFALPTNKPNETMVLRLLIDFLLGMTVTSLELQGLYSQQMRIIYNENTMKELSILSEFS